MISINTMTRNNTTRTKVSSQLADAAVEVMIVTSPEGIGNHSQVKASIQSPVITRKYDGLFLWDGWDALEAACGDSDCMTGSIGQLMLDVYHVFGMPEYDALLDAFNDTVVTG